MTIESMKQMVSMLPNMVTALSRVTEAYHSQSNPFHNPIHADAELAIRELKTFHADLRQAISQPDCRNCKNCDYDGWTAKETQSDTCLACTNGDKFQALPKVVLYKVTPQE